jgi:tRNA 5-methylaminomethyl-2-thiouridine biosynthesis bifunctional protein
VYPPLVEGVHTFWLGEIKVTLVWDWGEVALEHFPVVDAWFLDGFAPSKNETMWEMTLLQKIANRSKKGTTFATFTAASRVRKGLEEVGFCVQKQQGYGKKREMSTGVLMSPSLCVK